MWKQYILYRYGGELVVDGKLSGGDLLIVFFSVLIGAAQVGQVGPNVEAFMVARGAAYYIYNLMDRCPVIDSFSEEGSKPKISGDISFINCKFNYPSRPDIKVSCINFQKKKYDKCIYTSVCLFAFHLILVFLQHYLFTGWPHLKSPS